MNTIDKALREAASLPALDIMLADVAASVQLSPTDFRKATGRFETINDWADRPDSPLRGRIQLFYPQGSMAIGATIARHSDRDEYDIDIMAQLALTRTADPEAVLALLYETIRGEKGSRYYDMTRRRTRCVTVEYADGMHLDITPAVIIAERLERTSIIFHSDPDDVRAARMRLLANPYGFAGWFDGRMPPPAPIGYLFEKRSIEIGRLRAMAKADQEDVPDQEPFYIKPTPLIALQLIKRWRNLRYERRQRDPRLRGFKRPPSVLLSKYVADQAAPGRLLSAELLHQAEALFAIFDFACRRGVLVVATNPACHPDDCFTDRWPGSPAEQALFRDDLADFVEKLRRLNAGLPLPQMQAILEDLFGERPARDVVKGYIERYARDAAAGQAFHIPRTGSIAAMGSALPAPAIARPTPRNTFYGD